MGNEWITMSTLGTFGSVVFIVTVMTQFLKGIVDRFRKVPTRLLALLLAWAVLMGKHAVMDGGLTAQRVYLDLLNGFIVALAAMGSHQVAKDHLNWK